jgi:hypothetical protein
LAKNNSPLGLKTATAPRAERFDPLARHEILHEHSEFAALNTRVRSQLCFSLWWVLNSLSQQPQVMRVLKSTERVDFGFSQPWTVRKLWKAWRKHFNSKLSFW